MKTMETLKLYESPWCRQIDIQDEGVALCASAKKGFFEGPESGEDEFTWTTI